MGSTIAGIDLVDRARDYPQSRRVRLHRYSPTQAGEWDDFVKRSKNGTFLFERPYMDYHSDRFADLSLMAYEGERLAAVFPANMTAEGELVSHGGLTFGGWVTDTAMKTPAMLTLMEELAGNYRWITYKAVPRIYHRQPAEEDLYALSCVGARLIRRDVSSAVRMADPLPYATLRKRSIRKGRDLKVTETDDFATFHAILAAALDRHSAKPVHSVAELELLHGRFPTAIRLFGTFRDGEMLAGSLVFDNGHVAHTQYLACSDEGRSCGALDRVLDYFIREEFAQREWLSFGISTESGGRVLNEGLIAQKEGFGARAVVHDFYEIRA